MRREEASKKTFVKLSFVSGVTFGESAFSAREKVDGEVTGGRSDVKLRTGCDKTTSKPEISICEEAIKKKASVRDRIVKFK